MSSQGAKFEEQHPSPCSLEWDWEDGHGCAIAQEVNKVLSVIGTNVALAQQWLEEGHAVHERLMQIKLACEHATRLATRCAIGERSALEEAFERALQRTWLAYQPIVRFRTRDTFAYEALLRSKDPAFADTHALLDVAETLGRMAELGRHVRRQVATTMATGVVSQMFVNLHPYELLDEQLYAPDAPLSRFAHRIVLELTERTRLEEVHDVKHRVSRLRALGYRVAVDDAGAGYAGLTSIAQLGPEVVKIDMALVRGIDTELNKQRLVRALIALCQEMGAFVVVEGVETNAERDTLLGLGADLLQGYLFGEPCAALCPPRF